jgi:cell division protein FtsI/penicillin-binding protein 2
MSRIKKIRRKAKHKRKNLKRRIAIFFIVFTIIFFSVGIFLLMKSEEIDLERLTLTKETYEPVCEAFSKDVERCKIYGKECKNATTSEISFAICFAGKALDIDPTFQLSKKICEKLEDEDLQKYCMAKVISRSNIDAAKKFCEEIKDVIKKVECKADILKEIDMENALKECEGLNEKDKVNWCKAHIKAFENVEEGKKFCELITSEPLKQLCYLEVMKART